jgi:hypothetical protein
MPRATVFAQRHPVVHALLHPLRIREVVGGDDNDARRALLFSRESLPQSLHEKRTLLSGEIRISAHEDLSILREQLLIKFGNDRYAI